MTRVDFERSDAFEKTAGEVKVLVEGHYRLVDPNDLTDADLAAYRLRA